LEKPIMKLSGIKSRKLSLCSSFFDGLFFQCVLLLVFNHYSIFMVLITKLYSTSKWIDKAIDEYQLMRLRLLGTFGSCDQDFRGKIGETHLLLEIKCHQVSETCQILLCSASKSSIASTVQCTR
jgi:hypothetical protein